MPDALPDSLDQRLDAITRYPFRPKFQLRGRERAKAELSGSSVRWHARDLIATRLAPAEPYKDGRQAPSGREPVPGMVKLGLDRYGLRPVLERLGVSYIRAGSEEDRADR